MVKCRVCGESIVIYSASDGTVHILDKPRRGFTEAHICGDYEDMLSASMLKKCRIESDV